MAMKYPMTYPDGCDPAYSYNHTYNVWYAYTWMQTTLESRMVLYGLPIVVLLGIIGNGSFLFVVGKTKRLHNTTNLYLASLAMTDVIYLVWVCTMTLWVYVDSPVRHDTVFETSAGCTLGFAMGYFLYYTSTGLVTLVTYERYRAICSPLKHRANSSTGRTRRLIVGTLVASAALGFLQSLKFAVMYRYCVIWPHLPDFIGWPQTLEFCLPITTNLNIGLDVLDNVIFMIALSFNGYMYARIMYTLNNRNVGLEEDRPTETTDAIATKAQTQMQAQTIKIRNQVARMLIMNGTVFFLCQISSQINAMDYILTRTLGTGLYSAATTDTMLIVSRVLIYANSALNPFLYNFSSSYYREAYKDALCGTCIDRNRQMASKNSAARRQQVASVSSRV